MPTFEQRFLEKLAQLAGGSGVAISNAELRTALGWQPDTYNRERDKLIRSKKVRRAKGQGGSVLIPPAAPVPSHDASDHIISAFIS